MAASKADDVLQQLREGVTQLTNSDEWRRYLDVQRRFHTYSWGNCFLIMLQRPDATRVAGYKKWLSLERQVRKGERAIRILAPVAYRPVSDGEASAQDGEQSRDPRVVRAFRTAFVFDISQTEGEPLPEIATRLLGTNAGSALTRMQMVANELGYSVNVTSLPGARNGDCNFETKEIRLRDDLAPHHLVKTLAHEIAHTLLHHPSKLPAGGLTRDVAELEAESVAYTVCQDLGIDSSAYSLGYIAHWAGGGEKARKNLEMSASRINKAARTLIDGIEHPLLLAEHKTEPVKPGVGFQTLNEEMTAGMAMGEAGARWPEPLHRIDGHPVRSLLLTVPEACEVLSIGRSQLYELANKHHVIEMVHIGRSARVPRASLEEYVDRLRAQALDDGLRFSGELS